MTRESSILAPGAGFLVLERPPLPDPTGLAALLEQVEHATDTVVVVPAGWRGAHDSAPVVAATGHDLESDAAVGPAADLARRDRRPLVLAHIWGMPDLGEVELPPDPWLIGSIPDGQQRALALLATRVRKHTPGLVVETEVRQGRKVDRELVGIAQGAAAVVVGRRRRARGLLGRTARGLIEHAECPVVITGPGVGPSPLQG